MLAVVRRVSDRVFFFLTLSFALVQAHARAVTLEECIQMALENKVHVLEHQLKAEEESQHLLEAKSQKRPKLSFQAGTTKSEQDLGDFWDFPQQTTLPPLETSVVVLGIEVPITIDQTDIPLPQPQSQVLFGKTRHDMSLNFNMPLYTSGRLEALVGAARLRRETADLERLEAEQALKLQATEAFYALWEAQKGLEVVAEQVSSAEENVRASEALFSKGKIPELEVLNQRIALQEAKQRKLEAEHALELARAQLNLLIGEELTAPTEAEVGTLRPAQLPRKQTALKQARENRVAYRLLGLSRQIAQEQLRAARASGKPSVGLSATLSRTGTRFPPDVQTWSLSVGAQWPFYDSGETRARVHKAQVALSQLDLQKERLDKEIEMEVLKGWAQADLAIKRGLILEQRFEQAQEALRITKVRYKRGLASSKELQEAERLYLETRLSLLKSRAERELALQRLKKATGTL